MTAQEDFRLADFRLAREGAASRGWRLLLRDIAWAGKRTEVSELCATEEMESLGKR